MKWHQDLETESRLETMGLRFHFKALSVANDLLVADSRRNNARLDTPLHADVVEEYAISMEDKGASFPAIIVAPDFKKPGKYVVLCGNHRVAAAMINGIDAVDAYVIEDADQMTRDILARTDNRRQGIRQAKQEAFQHAHYMMRTYGMKGVEAAALFGIKSSWLHTEVRTEELRSHLMTLGVDPRGMSREIMSKLATIQGNEPVLKECARVLSTNTTSRDEAFELIEAVKHQKTEAMALHVAKEREAELRKHAGRKSAHVSQPIRKEFLRNFNSFANQIKGKSTLEELQVTDPAERARLIEQWLGMRATMDKIFNLTFKADTNGKSKHGTNLVGAR